MDWTQIIGYVVTFLIGSVSVAGGFAVVLRKASDEIGDVFEKLADALEDNKLTKEEIKELIAESLEVLAVFKRK